MNRNLYILFFVLINIGIRAQSAGSSDLYEKVFSYICEKEILHPHIAMQQAIIETGSFYPNNTMKKNNLFGFTKRRRVMKFNSWKESVDFYKDWQDRKYTDHNEDYYSFLVRIRYATNKKYISHLKSTKFNKSCDESQILLNSDNDSLSVNKGDTLSINIDTISFSVEKTQIHIKNNMKSKTYTVRKGDSLYKIARKNNTTVIKLKQANNLVSSLIKPGLRLKIP